MQLLALRISRLLKRKRQESPKQHWVPDTDVYSTDNGLVVKMEIGGMRSELLEITVDGNRLRIRGNRPDAWRARNANFHVMAIKYGPFENVVELPLGYDGSQAKAAYLNGFLRIDVPKRWPTPLRFIQPGPSDDGPSWPTPRRS
jgi:HSP20 family protein